MFECSEVVYLFVGDEHREESVYVSLPGTDFVPVQSSGQLQFNGPYSNESIKASLFLVLGSRMYIHNRMNRQLPVLARASEMSEYYLESDQGTA